MITGGRSPRRSELDPWISGATTAMLSGRIIPHHAACSLGTCKGKKTTSARVRKVCEMTNYPIRRLPATPDELREHRGRISGRRIVECFGLLPSICSQKRGERERWSGNAIYGRDLAITIHDAEIERVDRESSLRDISTMMKRSGKRARDDCVCRVGRS
jgi:hypothetical protein